MHLNQQIAVKETRKAHEEQGNTLSLHNLRGEQVFYGDNIQLLHEASGQWL